MRKLISLALGLSMTLGGLGGFLYMFFAVIEPVKLIFWMAPIFVFAVGVAILWEDVSDFIRRGR